MYDTSEVARLVGVSKQTLLRWIRTGLVVDVRRDQRGWRIWTNEDLERVKRFREAYHATEHPTGEFRAETRPDWASSLADFRSRHTHGENDA